MQNINNLSLKGNKISSKGAKLISKLCNLTVLDMAESKQLSLDGVKFLTSIPSLKLLLLEKTLEMEDVYKFYHENSNRREDLSIQTSSCYF